MRFLKSILLLAGTSLLVLGSRAALADEAWRSPLTIGEPTEIPGSVLEPGKYMVKVLDTNKPRMVVQFMNAEETKVFATVMAVPSYRPKSSEDLEFTYFQRAEGYPQALKTWFYPANYFGIEFVYPKAEALRIAEVRHEEVYAARGEEVIAITPKLEEVPIKVPPPEPVVAENILPKTASNLPLLALAGLTAVAAAAVLRALSSRKA